MISIFLSFSFFLDLWFCDRASKISLFLILFYLKERVKMQGMTLFCFQLNLLFILYIYKHLYKKSQISEFLCMLSFRTKTHYLEKKEQQHVLHLAMLLHHSSNIS